MTAENLLRALAAGENVPSGAVLQTARMSALGREVYGEEEIIEDLRRHPLGEDGKFISCDAHAVLYWADRALFADLSGAHIMRLWRLGPGMPVEREPAVSVPFDSDMTQARGDVIFQASDHLSLAESDILRVVSAGRDLAQNWKTENAPALRARAFCIRAFSTKDAVVALFSVHSLTGNRERTVRFVPALIVSGANETVVRDLAEEAGAGARVWQPRVA